MADHAFTEQQRKIFYEIVEGRRDVRAQFLSDPVEDEKIGRILNAAHHAPSVGFMQPWNFIVLRSQEKRKQVHDLFETANAEARQMFSGDKKQLYSRLKLQGILDSPLNICVTCDRTRGGKVVLGRTHNKETDLYSTVCAVQNLWLAARAEGIGVGWVSIFRDRDLQQVLGLPDHVVPIAYLCLGYVSHFNERPELEKKGWAMRLPIEELVMFDQWNGDGEDDPLVPILASFRKNAIDS